MYPIVDLTYVRFQVPDLAKQETFLNDFGMQTWQQDGVLYARGTDASAFIYSASEGDAAFLGLGFEADSQAALEKVAAIDGVAITENNAPGGGLIASFSDPDNYQMDLVWGMDKASEKAVPSRSPLNDGEHRLRLGERVTFQTQSHDVKRLGHCVLGVTDFPTSFAWYHERFGLISSDEIYAGAEENIIGAFMRCDRGSEYVDHHTLFLLGAGQPGFNHAAFEIANWDSLMAGHFSLQQAGYKHSWGVGKHLLGSQVFDYWKDPHDFTLEHFTDGDLFNVEFGSHKAPIDSLLGSHWGPEGAPN